MSDNYESFDRIESTPYLIKIKVIGVGRGGIKAVEGMLSQIKGVEFWAIDTNIETLAQTPISNCLTLADKSEWVSQIATALKDANLVLIVAGMGSKNGLDAIMEIAKVSKKIIGALTIGIVTRPFSFEGTERCTLTTVSIEQLGSQLDTLVTISNNKLLPENEGLTSNQSAFLLADGAMRTAIRVFLDTINYFGLVRVNFADIHPILVDAGVAYFGIGKGEGRSRARDAALQAISSPLLACSIEGARGVLTAITGGKDMRLDEAFAAADIIDQVLDLNVNNCVNVLVDESMEGKMQVSIIVTGFIQSTHQIE